MISGATFGASTGSEKRGICPAEVTEYAFHCMDRARRPSARPIRARSWLASMLLIELATAEAERGDKPPAIRRDGTIDPSQDHMRTTPSTLEGCASITQWPFAPPMPELDMEIRARPEGERTPSISGASGTRRLYSAHRIAGLGTEKLTVGGITPCSRIWQTLQSDARNAAISVCLGMM